jgi:AcrR family transcriptional regulator
VSPLQKISKEDILRTAFQLIRDTGAESLNARNVAYALHCSTQPIFSYYSNMAELKADAYDRADQYHMACLNKVEVGDDYFLNIGLAYIDFALEEPNLFRFLFLSDGFAGKKLNEIITEACVEDAICEISKVTDLGRDGANRLFTDMWLYAHGIASMLAANRIETDRSEIEAMLRNMFAVFTGGRSAVPTDDDGNRKEKL